jgi:BNR/Asp-box repeat
MNRVLRGVAVATIVLWHGAALAQMHHHGGGAKKEDSCGDASLACATTVTPTFAADGTLWVIWMAGDRISVAHSSDLGKTFSAAAAVTPSPQLLDIGPDARPKIVVDAQGRVVVTYTIFKDKRYNGQIFYSRSTDGGATFAPPQPLTDGAGSQRFDALAVDGPRIFAAWLDKREVVAAKAAGRDYVGAALAYAWSTDGGATFSKAHIAQSNTCECCRLGVTLAAPGRPAVIWRNAFGGTVRDHAVMTFTDPATPGPVYRVSVDDWRTDVCPHHGPSLSIGPDGSYHAAWFTDGEVRQGVFYARSTDGGRTFSAPMRIGDEARQPSRPYVLAVPGTVWLAWKEFDGERSTALVQVSHDGGATWSAPRVMASTADMSDHPLLLTDGRRSFLSWQTRLEGYRLLSLESNS